VRSFSRVGMLKLACHSVLAAGGDTRAPSAVGKEFGYCAFGMALALVGVG
jgi:hypothetical protein